MARKPKITFDLDYLSSLGVSSDAPRELYYLGEEAQQILSQLAEMVLWPTRWYEGKLPAGELPSLAYAVYEELKVPLHLDDLKTELDELDATQASIVGLLERLLAAQCCDSGMVGDVQVIGTDPAGEPDDVTVGTGDVPDAFDNNPLADYDSSGSIGWDDYAVYLCDAGHRTAAMIGDWMARLQFAEEFDLFAIARFFAGEVLTRLFPGEVDDVLIMLWDEFYALAEEIGDWVTGTPASGDWDDIWDAWHGGVRDDVICAIAQATSASAAAADVRSLLQSLYDGATWNAIWTAFPFGRVLKKVFAGAQAYEGPYACDCPDPLISGQLNLIPIQYDSDWTMYANRGDYGTPSDQGDDAYLQPWALTGNPEVNGYISLSPSRDLSGFSVVQYHGVYFELVDRNGTDIIKPTVGTSQAIPDDGLCYWDDLPTDSNGQYTIVQQDIIDAGVPSAATFVHTPYHKDGGPWSTSDSGLVTDDAVSSSGSFTWRVWALVYLVD